MPAWNVLFWKKYIMSFVLEKCCFFLAIILCIDELVWKLFWSLIMKFINETIYWHGTCRFSNCLNWLLHEALASAGIIILTRANLPNVWKITPENYSIFSNRVKLCVVNRFECVNIICAEYKFKCFFFFLYQILIKFQSGEHCMTEYDNQVSNLLSRSFLLSLSSLLQGKFHIFKLRGRIM